VPQAIAAGYADAGIIFHHLAQYYAAEYPERFTIVTVSGADRLSSTIAMVRVADPLRAQAANAFVEFFLEAAREVYPRYGFTMMSEAEFGARIALD